MYNNVSNNHHRLFIVDKSSGKHILIDTGSDVSIWPTSSKYLNVFNNNNKKSQRCNFQLFAHNGTRITAYGLERITIDLGFGQPFTYTFIIAESGYPIIGADFLSHFHLLPDLKNKLLIDPDNQRTVKAYTKSTDIYGVSTINQDIDPRVRELLSKFPSITRTKLTPEVKHNVKHSIRLTDENETVFAHPTRLDPIKLKAVKDELNKMLESGIIQTSSSSFASRIVVVPKANGQLRLCGDYRMLNRITIPDRYPIKHIEDFSQSLRNTKIFSTIDLLSAFHQIPVCEEDRFKTAITTPVGLYEYIRLPFGLRNAPSTFQRFIDQVFRELDFIYCYQDDLLIASENDQQHINHLEKVFNKLNEYGLTINIEKSKFFQTEVKFLAHIVDKNGIRISPDKLKAIDEFPQPDSLKSLKRFIGMANYYRRFIPHAAKIMSSLHSMSKTDFEWTDERLKAFNDIKAALREQITLSFIDPKAKLVIKADASDHAIGGCLEQITSDNKVEPLGFCSKKLRPEEFQLAPFDKELRAAHHCVKHFEHLIEGRQFTLYTDHKPLVNALLVRTNVKRSPMQMRLMSYILEFTSDIRHISGTDNVVADCLSRVEIEAITSSDPSSSSTESLSIEPISLQMIANEQHNQLEEMESYRTEFGPRIKLQRIDDQLILVHVDDKSPIRPVIPSSLHKRIFHLCHGHDHKSANKTRQIAADRYFWKSMNADIKQWCRTCQNCQKSKIHRHTIVPPKQIDIPKIRFSHINIDIVGPLPQSPISGNRYLLTCIDRFTRWPEAIPMSSISAENVANLFVTHWISRFGIPDVVTTDRGTQFESQLFHELTKLIGTKHIRTAAFNPRANGMIERFHRTLKSSIMATGQQWEQILPMVLLGLRTVVKDDLQSSSAELVYGSQLTIPADLVTNNDDILPAHEFVRMLKEHVAAAKSAITRPSRDSRCYIPDDLTTAEYVFLLKENRRTLERPYTGPFKVINRRDSTYEIETQNGLESVALHRLKPAYIERDDQIDLPRKRGRPAKKVQFAENLTEEFPIPARANKPDVQPAIIKRKRGRPRKVQSS